MIADLSRPDNRVASIRIDAEFQKAIPPLSTDERAGLEAKLKAEGCTEKLRSWENDPDGPSLIDGHHRYEICNRLGIGFSVLGIRFPDRDAVLLWIEENQLSRRNLTDDQRAVIALGVMQRRSEIAKRDQRSAAGKASAEARRSNGEDQMTSPLKVHLGGSKDLQAERDSDNDATGTIATPTPTQPKPRSRAATAKEAKVSERKLRAAAMVKKAKPELMGKVADGTMSLKEAARQAKPDIAPNSEKGSDQPPVDEEGVPVPDHLHEAFARRAEFDAVLNHLTRLSGLVNKLMGKQREPVPVGAECLHRQDINKHQDNLRSAIRFGRPHAVCPYCGGSRKTGAETCGGCRGAGWVAEISYKQAPKEYKEKLKGAA